MIDNGRLRRISEECVYSHGRYNIGTYRERSQHLVLKKYFEENAELHEVPVGGYIADIKKGNDITEIQTSGFGSLRRKLEAFSALDYSVTVVYPSPVRQRIIWVDPDTGERTQGRLINRPKAVYKLLPELLYISDFFGNEKICVRAVLLCSESVRLLDGFGDDRKSHATKLDTVPVEILDITDIRDADALRALLPFNKGQNLKSGDISKLLSLSRRNLWAALKLLVKLEILIPSAKEGNSIVYTVT